MKLEQISKHPFGISTYPDDTPMCPDCAVPLSVSHCSMQEVDKDDPVWGTIPEWKWVCPKCYKLWREEK